MKYFLVAVITVLIIFLGACSSGPSNEEMAASVEAQVDIRLTEIANSIPEDTATPSPTHTPDVPKPTETPVPNPVIEEEITDWWSGILRNQLPVHLEEDRDDFEGITYHHPEFRSGSQLIPFIQARDGETPEIFWDATYLGEDWIFMEGLKVKVGDTIYDLSDRFSDLNVSSEVLDGGRVLERVVFPFERQDEELLSSPIDNTTAIRFDGSDGNEDLEFNWPDHDLVEWIGLDFVHSLDKHPSIG